jgi:hypothetical protein
MFMKTAAVVLFAACLSAQKPATAEELLIRRLSNPDAAAADAAMIDLIRGGPPSAVVLKSALANCQDPKFRERADRALGICSVDAPIDNGVKVGLRADRTEVKPGQTVAFTATVCNVSDAPVAICLGMSSTGNALERGFALQRVDADGTQQARLSFMGVCGTGAQAIVVVLPPWTSKEFTTKVEYRLKPHPDKFVQYDGPHFAADLVFLPVEPEVEGGKVKLRLHLEVDPAMAAGREPANTKPDWKGTLESNTIALQLRGR